MSKKIDFQKFLRLATEGPSDVTPAENAMLVEKLQLRLEQNLPRAYRQVVTRFSFPAFDTGKLWFFENRDDCLEAAIFRDREMYPTLLANSLIQIGCRSEGDYDPVCFDMREAVRGREPPLVWLDHEAILCHRQIRRNEQIARSFPDIVRTFLADRP